MMVQYEHVRMYIQYITVVLYCVQCSSIMLQKKYSGVLRVFSVFRSTPSNNLTTVFLQSMDPPFPPFHSAAILLYGALFGDISDFSIIGNDLEEFLECIHGELSDRKQENGFLIHTDPAVIARLFKAILTWEWDKKVPSVDAARLFKHSFDPTASSEPPKSHVENTILASVTPSPTVHNVPQQEVPSIQTPTSTPSLRANTNCSSTGKDQGQTNTQESWWYEDRVPAEVKDSEIGVINELPPVLTTIDKEIVPIQTTQPTQKEERASVEKKECRSIQEKRPLQKEKNFVHNSQPTQNKEHVFLDIPGGLRLLVGPAKEESLALEPVVEPLIGIMTVSVSSPSRLNFLSFFPGANIYFFAVVFFIEAT